MDVESSLERKTFWGSRRAVGELWYCACDDSGRSIADLHGKSESSKRAQPRPENSGVGMITRFDAAEESRATLAG
jgi:hypothetical protein